MNSIKPSYILNLAIMKTNGLKSKFVSVNNIVNTFDIRALVVSETYCATPLLSCPINKNFDLRTGILHIVRDP